LHLIFFTLRKDNLVLSKKIFSFALEFNLKAMNLVYISEDGHEYEIEDFIIYAIWKIQDLKDQNYTEEEILCFDDSIIWHEFVKNRMENKNT
jgi:hypothetical protein